MTSAPRRYQPCSDRRCSGLPFKPAAPRKLLSALIAACCGAAVPLASANPTLPQVAAGQAAFSQQGNVFSVTNTPNTIINWASFSIGRDEITRFIQQNGDSRVLNRITGQDPSAILGTLQSNGKVYLINPNGVLFGRDSRVDVGGLVASTLNLSNADFLAGNHHFSGAGTGAVANHGSIATPQGGQVYLIAPDVTNTGIIQAPGGEVLLAAGHSVQLVDSANPAVHVVVSAPEDRALNLGSIVASGGGIGIYGALVNQRGSVNADSAVVGANGRVVLKASRTALLEEGSVTTARGAGTGGTVQVLGERVGLTGNARVDAGGARGGGTVQVGGGWQGRDASVPNAARTYVGKDTVIAADALESGQGGTVVAWGDEVARVHGTLSARGAGAGKGGRIETSGHQLDVAGIRVAARGPAGNGTWLLDPYDIDVKKTTTGSATLDDVARFDAGPESGATEIATALIDGAAADVVLQARHDITFSDAVNIAGAGIGLTAQAGHDIGIKAGITTNGGNVTLSAADPAAGGGFTGGAVNLGAALRTGGGSVALSGGDVTVAGAVDAGAGGVMLAALRDGGMLQLAGGASVRGGAVSLRADSMDLQYGSAVRGDEVFFDTYATDQAITLGAAGAWLGKAELAAVAAPRVVIGARDGYTGTVTVTGALDLTGTLAGAGGRVGKGTGFLQVQGGAIAVNGALSVREGLTLTAVNGAVTQTAPVHAGVLAASGDAVALEHAGNRVSALAGIARDGTFRYRDANNVYIASTSGAAGIVATEGVTLTAAGGIAQSADSTIVTPALALVAAGDKVYLDQQANRIAALRVAAAGDVLVNTADDIAVDGVTLAAHTGRSVAIGAGGTLTVNGFDVGANTVTLAANRIDIAQTIKADTVSLKSSGGGITQHAAPDGGIAVGTLDVAVAGPNAGAVLLDNPDNRIGTVDIRTGGAVNLANGRDLAGSIAADTLALRVDGSIGTKSAPLQTTVGTLAATSIADHGKASIDIVNNAPGQGRALTVQRLALVEGNHGDVTLNNYGATVIGEGAEVLANDGDIAVRAHSPLMVQGTVATGGNIVLEAGASGSSEDALNIGPQAQVRAGGDLFLIAGANIYVAQLENVSATKITWLRNMNNGPGEGDPDTSNPDTGNPDTGNPGTGNPDTGNPGTGNPDTGNPGTGNPDTGNPGTGNPDTGNPGTGNPDTGGPGTGNPDPDTPIKPPPLTDADQCRLTPALPGCAAIAPPSQQDPVKPVQLATNEAIAAINRPARELGGGHEPDDSGPPQQEDNKDSEGGDNRAAAPPGTRDDKPAIKNYCN